MSETTKSADPIHDVNETVSMGECTGIMPAGIQSDEQGENVGELYSIHPPQGGKRRMESGLGAKNAGRPKPEKT